MAASRPRTAIRLADPVLSGGAPVAALPQEILRRQLECLAERGPGRDVNPYLAQAAMIAAGLHGEGPGR